MHQCKQYKQTVYTDACLPKNAPSGSKHIENIKKNKNLNINLENVHFVGLYFITNMHTYIFSSSFGSHHKQEISVFLKTSRPAVGPT
jgi:hypothetical protein